MRGNTCSLRSDPHFTPSRCGGKLGVVSVRTAPNTSAALALTTSAITPARSEERLHTAVCRGVTATTVGQNSPDDASLDRRSILSDVFSLHMEAEGGRKWNIVRNDVGVNKLSGLHRASVKDGDTAAGLPSQIYTKLQRQKACFPSRAFSGSRKPGSGRSELWQLYFRSRVGVS